MSNFIGRGEREALSILKFVCGLEQRHLSDWPEPGIYTQVSLPFLLSKKYQKDLNEIHQKSSVDIVVISKKRYAVYVNGGDHCGELKSKRDAVRYRMLEDSGYKIVKISEYECKELFRQRINPKSVWEVCNALLMAGM